MYYRAGGFRINNRDSPLPSCVRVYPSGPGNDLLRTKTLRRSCLFQSLLKQCQGWPRMFHPMVSLTAVHSHPWECSLYSVIPSTSLLHDTLSHLDYFDRDGKVQGAKVTSGRPGRRGEIDPGDICLFSLVSVGFPLSSSWQSVDFCSLNWDHAIPCSFVPTASLISALLVGSPLPSYFRYYMPQFPCFWYPC